MKLHLLPALALSPLWVAAGVLISMFGWMMAVLTDDNQGEPWDEEHLKAYKPTTGNGKGPAWKTVKVIGFDEATGAILTNATRARDIIPGSLYEAFPEIRNVMKFGEHVVINAPYNAKWSDFHFTPDDGEARTSRIKITPRWE